MKTQKSLKTNAIYSFLKAFLNIAAPLITFPYASRILMPEGIGRVNFANTVVTYFIMFAKLGIDNYATREASKIKDDKDKLTKFVKEILTINTISTIISFTLFFIAIFFIDKFSSYRTLLIICSIRMGVMLIEVPWLFNANEDFKSVTIRTAFFQFLSLIFLFIFVRTPEDINYYGLFGVLTISGTAISNFIIARKYINLKYKCKLELKKHIPFIITFFGMAFITNFYNMLDTLMLGFLSTDQEVGYYSSAIKVNNLIIELISAISIVILPRLSFYKENNQHEEFLNLTKKSFNIILLIAIPFTTGVLFLSKHIILILTGASFLPSVLPMKLLTPLIIFISISNLIGTQIFPAINKEKTSLLVYTIAIIINITFNFILIPTYGSVGASISTLFAEFIVSVLFVILSRKYIFSKNTIINLLQIIFATIVMSIFIMIILYFIDNFILQVIISIFVGVISYSTILFMLKNIYFNELISKFIRK